jgi:hypothetical protein
VLRFWLLVLSLAAMPALAQRVLVLPVGGDVDRSTATTLGRAVETAVREALPVAEVMTAATLETSIGLSEMRDCATAEAIGACMSEIADAAHADVVVSPHLGRLGDEYVFTVTMTGGVSARLLGQGQRRVPVARPASLLDVTPELIRRTAIDAGLVRASREVPGAAIAVGVGGAVGAGVGVALLVTRAIVAAEYDKGNLARDQASSFETLQEPALLGGVVIVVVGGVAALAGTGVAVWASLE